tara:strand:- start:926 stop:1660 length:735 start_codon:yes stop_codon:yes gene_type:complete
MCKIFTIVLLLSNFIYSQVITVIDKNTSLPLSEVNIYTKESGTTTSNDGVCDLSIFSSDDIITFSLIGYKSISIKKTQILNVLYLNSETIPLELVNVIGKSKRSKRKFSRLERDVRKVYPFAKMASELLVMSNGIIDSLDQYSTIKRYREKRKIFKEIEKKLLLKHGKSARRLTRSQGRILIRLIDRETNRTSYNIIKHFRNIFSAGFWQLTAKFFGHDLKTMYNSKKGQDRFIEFIVRRIENE